VDIRIRGPLRK
jgi:hypothetical protein